MKKTQSKLYRLNGWDFVKGLGHAGITSALTAVYKLIEEGNLSAKGIKTAGLTALGAMIAYLLRKLFSSPVYETPPVCEEPPVDYDTPAKPDNTPGA